MDWDRELTVRMVLGRAQAWSGDGETVTEKELH